MHLRRQPREREKERENEDSERERMREREGETERERERERAKMATDIYIYRDECMYERERESWDPIHPWIESRPS